MSNQGSILISKFGYHYATFLKSSKNSLLLSTYKQMAKPRGELV